MARAGLFRDRITFQRMASTADAYGNVTGAWADHVSRSADFRERLGKEAIEGGALQDVGLVTMRLRSDSVTQAITASDRVFSARARPGPSAPSCRPTRAGESWRCSLRKALHHEG
jgi:head-tail adaptor